MKIVIIEDELIAAESLQSKIQQLRPEAEVVAVLRSVKQAVRWFQENELPELIFMDIQLIDGLSFCIFDQVDVRCPIVFTTSYDEYALRAFEVNCVDYLLKPVSEEKLERAFQKIEQGLLSGKQPAAEHIHAPLSNLFAAYRADTTTYPRSLLIPNADKYVPLEIANIAFIKAEMKMAKIFTLDGRCMTLDKSLDAMQQLLDPREFFRANRQYIIARKAVRDISHWFKSKLRVNMLITPPDDIVVPNTSAAEFKQWMVMG